MTAPDPQASNDNDLEATAPGAASAWRFRARREWLRHRQEFAIAGVMAVALMSGYVHVLHRAVADGPARQQAAFDTASTHDAEADRREADALRPDDDHDHDARRHRVLDRFSLPHGAAVAASM